MTTTALFLIHIALIGGVIAIAIFAETLLIWYRDRKQAPPKTWPSSTERPKKIPTPSTIPDLPGRTRLQSMRWMHESPSMR